MKRSTEGLRETLFETLEQFRAGTVDATHVKAVTSVTNAILATVAKDLEAARLLADLQDPNKPKALEQFRLSLPLGALDVVDVLPVEKPRPQPESTEVPPAQPVEPAAEPQPHDREEEQDDRPATGFGQLLSGVMHDHANGVTRHKGSRY